MEALLAAYAFVLGTLVGSFLNVVIARVPAGESVVRPRSRCPRCKSPIAWYDNLPIVSWIALRAKCRHCALPISPRYPVVELIGGVLALALLRTLGPSWATVGYFAFAAALVALAYIDLDTWLLPHEITWPLLGVGLLSPLWNPRLGFVESALGAAAGFAVLGSIAFIGEKVFKREAMGWGDVWLLAGIGAWLGWRALLPVVLLAAVQGSVVGLSLLAAGRKPSSLGAPLGEEAQPPDGTTALPGAEAATSASTTPGIAPETGAGTAAETSVSTTPSAAPETSVSTDPSAAPETSVSTDPSAAPESSAGTADDDWVPPPHAVPFGPFLALAALEQLLLGDLLFTLWDGLVRRLLFS